MPQSSIINRAVHEVDTLRKLFFKKASYKDKSFFHFKDNIVIFKKFSGGITLAAIADER